MSNENNVHPLWGGFNSLHWWVAIILALLLAITAFMKGGIPWTSAHCSPAPKVVVDAAPVVAEPVPEPVVVAEPVAIAPVVEPVVAAPYVLEAVVDATRNAVITGYVPDQASIDAIKQAASANYGPNVTYNLEIVDGAPANWTATAVDAIANINPLRNGEISMRNTEISISGLASSGGEADSVKSNFMSAVGSPYNAIYSISAPAADVALADLVVDGYTLVDDVPDAKIYFDTSVFTTPADVQSTLASVVASLQANPDMVAIVSGFHDARGDFDMNQELSYNRAKSVRSDMNTAGIDNTRIIMEKPSETTGSGDLAEARRVEVYLGYRN